MTRHHRITAVATAGLLLALLLAACSLGDGTTAAEAVESDVPRVRATAEDAAAGGAVARRVGAALYPHLVAGTGTGNLAYSPASIALALGMTRSGAAGESADQLDALLGTDPTSLHPGLNGLETTLGDRNGRRTNSKAVEAEIALSTANSLWGQRDVEWEPPFLDTLQQHYGVGIHVVDYQGDHEGAREAVNDWVADRTDDEITDLIGEDVFTADTRLTLVNALYLAAPWDDTFDEAGDQPFAAPGRSVSAPMMTGGTVTTHQEGEGWEAVTIPYAGGELAMTLLVPDEGRLADVEAALDHVLLTRVLTGGRPATVALTWPRYDVRSALRLRDALEATGVVAPFDTEHVFDPMSADQAATPLQLADVVHQATVTVDEQGTVAAAATAAVFETVGGPIYEKELVVDRPFLFVIHDLETAAPLFLGRITDPTAP